MDVLRDIFEAQLRIDIDPEGNAVIGETKFSPVEILSADEEAYRDEQNKWLSGTWLPAQLELLETILKVRANRDRFADLCGAIERRQVAPFVGSGMSVGSGLETWYDFLFTVRRYSKISETDLSATIHIQGYEEAADLLIANMPPRLFDERIEHELRIDGFERITGAVRFLPRLFSELILTTNLDDLLETLYRESGKPFGSVLIGDGIVHHRQHLRRTDSVLLKLHGDCRQRGGRVLGRNEYDAAYGAQGIVRNVLKDTYRTWSLLCLGCSLGTDRTVELIAEVAATDPNAPKHYAFLKLPITETEQRDREYFLIERGIFPIWYEGEHDECIQALLVGLLNRMKLI